jgi:hypothetical protein
MSIFKQLTDMVGGSLFKEVKETVMAYWPPEIAPEKRMEMQLKLEEAETNKRAQLAAAMASAEQAVTDRAALLEGSAQDLRAIPIVGPLVLFLRGLQRPVWGYAVLYGDGMWFMGQWELNQSQESALWVINALVLGFLFGERAVQNLTPFVTEMMKARKQSS